MNAEALSLAGFFSLRLVVIISVGAVVFHAYPGQTYGREIGRIFSHLPIGRKTIAKTELIITLALRFIPSLKDEYARIRFALWARGQGTQSSFRDSMQNYRKTIFPLIINALRRAEQVSWSLQSRGFNAAAERTNLNAIPIRFWDTIGAFTLCALSIVTLWL